jgi:hypothetical protein
MGNTWRSSPWTETDGRMAGGGGLRRPAVVRGGGGVPVGLRRREGAEEVRLGSAKLWAMLVCPEDRRS